jgi:hypothetical protein
MKFCLLLFILSCKIFANETEVISSLHGGVVKKTESTLIEFVQTNDSAKVYVSDHIKKNIANQKLSIKAIANIKGKEYPMELRYENDHYALSPYAKLKDEQNFVLSFIISFPLPSKKEKASFKFGK